MRKGCSDVIKYIEEDSVVDYCPNGVVLKTGGCRAMVCEHFGVWKCTGVGHMRVKDCVVGVIAGVGNARHFDVVGRG